MKSMKQSNCLLYLCMLAALWFAGCTPGKKGKVLVEKRSTGLPFEVVVVSETKYWKSILGERLRDELEKPYPALPQREATSRISYCEPYHFNGLMRYVRNILIVDIDDKVYTQTKLVSENDVWASAQLVLRLQSPSSVDLEKYLIERGDTLNTLIRQAEQQRYVAYLADYHSSFVDKSAREQFHLRVHAPEGFDSFKEDSLFLWVSNNANSGRMDMVFYDFPAESEQDLAIPHLIVMRDSVMKRNILGSFDGSYMTTEKRVDVQGETIKEGQSPSVLIRGLWRVEGDMMGGPFVSRALFDKARHRVVVAEGFVYAPETNKKNYMHRLESSLRTIRLLP